MKAIATVSFVAAFLWSQAGPTAAQIDPDAVMDVIARQLLEAARDRELCLRAGFRGPDVERCILALDLERRVEDFSEFAAPTQPTPPRSPSVSGSSPCATAQQPAQGVYAINDRSQRVARLTIRVASGANYFVKLEHAVTGRPVMSFFIYGGSTFEAMVPVGEFTLKYATGKIWCGEAELFGPDTLTNKAEKTFRFQRQYTGDGYTLSNWTVELVLQRGGNLRTARIPRETF